VGIWARGVQRIAIRVILRIEWLGGLMRRAVVRWMNRDVIIVDKGER